MASLCPAEGATAVDAQARVANAHAYASGDDRATRSAEVLQKLVPSQDGPGCAAAVGVQGSVVGEAGRGKTDLTTGHAITSTTVLDMASNSRQCTADAVLLLAGRHQLALGDLMRHTSGIPDYQDLLVLEAKGIELTAPAGQEEEIAAILASQPQDPPGEGFSDSNSNSYSNSHYAVLAHVVERVTSKPFPTFIQQTAVTIVCNADPPDTFRAANQLLDIWTK
ncbi:serine hydrolase domain-containing protein [Streptomyces sp. NPDC008343]|uniref:serine hydrolase domain-containing protein n=1 Tax=Streptomyces sp. NPDC008343 TaxID=3364828 RepID=UPI0036ECA750